MWNIKFLGRSHLPVRVLIVGEFYKEIYEKAFYNSFKELGYEVHEFGWHKYFKGHQYNLKRHIIASIYYRFQNKYLIGPSINELNADLLKKCEEVNPDLVFIYRGTHVFPKTIKNIKKNGSVVMCYNNDDPFSDKQQKYIWRHYLSSLPYCDFIFAFREKNIIDYNKIGFQNVDLLRIYYIVNRNFPIEHVSDSKYKADVLFVGHFEDDGRDEYIKRLIEAGINIKLYGPGWERSKYYSFFKEKFGEIKRLDKDYNLCINSCKIALVFLSKLNNDTYTTRCFEIPATKTFMLSEYTNDLDDMFQEGIEAEYFRDYDELLKKIKHYLENDKNREEIALAGYQRLKKDGHEVTDRVKEVIEKFHNIKSKYSDTI